LELKYTESTFAFWLKVLVGYSTCLIAAATALYSYVTPFKDSKVISFILVTLYVIHNIFHLSSRTLNSLYICRYSIITGLYQIHVFLSRESVFKGHKEESSGTKYVKVITKMKKPSPLYTLSIYTAPKKFTKLKDASCLVMETSVEKYFFEDGHFDVATFTSNLKTAFSKKSE
jgi:hypothetical protein